MGKGATRFWASDTVLICRDIVGGSGRNQFGGENHRFGGGSQRRGTAWKGKCRGLLADWGSEEGAGCLGRGFGRPNDMEGPGEGEGMEDLWKAVSE